MCLTRRSRRSLRVKAQIAPPTPTSVFPSLPSHWRCADRYSNIGTSDSKRICLSADSRIIRSIAFPFSLFYLFHTGWQELHPLGLIWMLKCHSARYFLSRTPFLHFTEDCSCSDGATLSAAFFDSFTSFSDTFS